MTTSATERAARLATRWERLWSGLHLQPPRDGFEALLARYRERHRAYHTDQHLEECLDRLDQTRHLATFPEAIELALWYHDAIYQPRAPDNEAASAALAERELTRVGAPRPLITAVVALILHTAHQAEPPPGDPTLLVDIDLAILGADQARYAEYELQVRREFRWVPAMLFRSRRAAILRAFRNRPRLYGTDFFHDRLEGAARKNLSAAIDALDRGAG